MNRNQREGRYYGWVKGRHLRWNYPHKVSSWSAFRLYNDRRIDGRYKKGATA